MTGYTEKTKAFFDLLKALGLSHIPRAERAMEAFDAYLEAKRDFDDARSGS